MTHPSFNKYRASLEVLKRARDVMIDHLADEILDQEDNLVEGGFHFNEFLESHGTKLHYLCMMISHLEMAAEKLEEPEAIHVTAGEGGVRRKKKKRKEEKQPSIENKIVPDCPVAELSCSEPGSHEADRSWIGSAGDDLDDIA